MLKVNSLAEGVLGFHSCFHFLVLVLSSRILQFHSYICRTVVGQPLTSLKFGDRAFAGGRRLFGAAGFAAFIGG